MEIQKEMKDLMNNFIDNCNRDIENRLPEWAQSSIRVGRPKPNRYSAKVQVKGLGKTIAVKEESEDFYSAIRTAKRKAIARAQSYLRKRRGRWRHSGYWDEFYPSSAS